MKLHLGCGQRYLEGYLNVDFPLSVHTAQTESVADLHADITSLRYSTATVDEVRLHHVFEHFPRPVACGLLACWHSWLKPDAVLHIEVPDFAQTAKTILGPFSSFSQRAVAERHLFGTHEAPWAAHYEGYTRTLLKKMLSSFGFAVGKVKRNVWCGTCNIEVIAQRNIEALDREQFMKRADTYLRHFLLNSEELEMRIHAVWMESFAKQLDKGSVL